MPLRESKAWMPHTQWLITRFPLASDGKQPAVVSQSELHGACIGAYNDPMFMQDKFNNARGVIYTIGLAVLAVLLAWKFIFR